MGYSPWGHKESDTSDLAHTHAQIHPLRPTRPLLSKDLEDWG